MSPKAEYWKYFNVVGVVAYCLIAECKQPDVSLGALPKPGYTAKLSGRSAKIVFATYVRQKCVNCFCDIFVPKVRKSLSQHTRQVPKLFLQKCKIWMLQQYCLNKIFVQKVSWLFGNFPDSPETFYTVRKLSILSRKFPDYLETFRTNWKLSSPSGNFSVRLETFQTIW